MSTSSALQGKTALIVGGAGGIGKAIGAAYVNEGARVVLAATVRQRSGPPKKLVQ